MIGVGVRRGHHIDFVGKSAMTNTGMAKGGEQTIAEHKDNQINWI